MEVLLFFVQVLWRKERRESEAKTVTEVYIYTAGNQDVLQQPQACMISPELAQRTDSAWLVILTRQSIYNYPNNGTAWIGLSVGRSKRSPR